MKNLEIIEEVKSQDFITEKQINLLKRRLNDGKIDFKDFEDLIDFDLSEEQNKKGIEFLIRHNFKTNGDLRNKSKLGFREVEILENFERFTFDGFYPVGNQHFKQFQPIYSVCSKDNSFQYYFNGGEMFIIG
jgi:hypothetical protein